MNEHPERVLETWGNIQAMQIQIAVLVHHIVHTSVDASSAIFQDETMGIPLDLDVRPKVMSNVSWLDKCICSAICIVSYRLAVGDSLLMILFT